MVIVRVSSTIAAPNFVKSAFDISSICRHFVSRPDFTTAPELPSELSGVQTTSQPGQWFAASALQNALSVDPQAS